MSIASCGEFDFYLRELSEQTNTIATEHSKVKKCKHRKLRTKTRLQLIIPVGITFVLSRFTL